MTNIYFSYQCFKHVGKLLEDQVEASLHDHLVDHFQGLARQFTIGVAYCLQDVMSEKWHD